jgi:hypothetical protein
MERHVAFDVVRGSGGVVAGDLRRFILAMASVVAFVLVSASPAFAAVDQVTSTSGDPAVTGSFPYEINNAQPGDTITFAPAVTGTITLSQNITIAKNLTIQGPGAGTLTISGNFVTQILNIASGTVSISGLTFLDGATGAGSTGTGGAINSDSSSLLTVNASTFVGNSAGGQAGMTADSGAGSGGAIADNHGPLTVVDSTFIGNSAGGPGNGGVYSGSGYGGAIGANGVGGTFTVTGSTFVNNTAGGPGGSGGSSGQGSGGAISESGYLTITDSTFTGNRAGGIGGSGQGSGSGVGGAIDSATLLVSDTIDGNSVGPGGNSQGSGISGAFNVTANATIISGNTGAPNCDGQVSVANYSLEGPAGQTTCGFDLTSADPLLAGLGSNGGPTQTQSLPANSPAVGIVPAANCPTTVDQRHLPRPVSGQSFCDVGSYEFQGPFLPSTQTTVSCSPTTVLVNSASTCTATVTGGPQGTVSFAASPSARGTFTSVSCTLALVSGSLSQSSCAVSYTPSMAGSQTIRAGYTGSGFAASNGSTTLQSVNPKGTVTSLVASPNPSVVGAQVMYTATVNPAPSGGTVAFNDGGAVISGCSAVAVSSSSGVATCNVTYDTFGSHSIAANYVGSVPYLSSASTALIEVINTATNGGPLVTTTTLSTSANPAVTGEPVTLNATVAPRPDGGSVTFLDNGTAIPGCGAVTVSGSSGQVSCQRVFPRSGPHSITATYSGDSAFASSVAGTLTETVHSSVALNGAPSGAGGVVTVNLTCATRSNGCQVTGGLTSTETVKSGKVIAVGARAKSAHHVVAVGTRTATIAAGQTVAVTIKLGASGHALLTKFHRLPVTLTISVSVSGQSSTLSTRKLTVTPARHKRTKH